jgi:hypothetical protein
MIGALCVAIWFTANTSLGTSTTFTRAAGMALNLVAPEHVATNPYYKANKPIVDWQFMLVLGIPVGAYLSARLSRGRIQFSTRLPEAWVSRFGTSRARRWTVGLLGGILVGFGARFADG